MERNTAKRTLEKLLSVCICLCMLGAMLPAQVFAEEADTAQTETVQDTAPKDTVYLSSADDLIQLAKNCRLDSWSQNRTVVLEVTPVRLKIARLTAWYPAPARLAALPVSIRSRAVSTAAR